MAGAVLWFNVEKGHGFIQTEEGERLYVARSGFLPKHEPMPRCKGREVSFHRQVHDADVRAVEVSFVTRREPPRARLRTPRGGRSLCRRTRAQKGGRGRARGPSRRRGRAYRCKKSKSPALNPGAFWTLCPAPS